MTDRDALYRAILAHPDDDTPRLVYADWLQENDRSEEAEFIRIGCQLESLPPDHHDYVELLVRQEELKLCLGAHAPRSTPALAAGLVVSGGPEWWKSTYRGFPRFLIFDGSASPGLKPMRALAKALQTAFTKLPARWLVVQSVTVEQLAELLKQPVIAQLENLTVILEANEGPIDDAARVIAACSRLKNLRGLVLLFGVGDVGADALARSKHLEQLQWLTISAAFLTPTAIRSLGNALWFRNLQSLWFDDTLASVAFEELCRLEAFPRLHTLGFMRAYIRSQHTFSSPACRAFASSGTFPALTRLTLCEVGVEQALTLLRAPWLRLAYLDLGGCGIQDQGAEALAAAPWVGSLRYLRLWSNSLDPDGVVAIAGCRKLTQLKFLDLGNSAPGVRGLRALATNPALRGLLDLDLASSDAHNTRLTSGHFHDFLAKIKMPKLRNFSLFGRPVGPKAVKLLTAEKFHALTRLNLRSCNLTNAAVATLLAAPSLQNLIELDLSNNGLHEGLRALASASTMPRLSSCNLRDNRIGPALRKTLHRRAVLRNA
jgi:uncharacterized protein (TIGR02996 family)